MKIVQVIPSVAARTGGTAYAVLHLAHALQSLGLESPVFSTDQAGPAQLGSRANAYRLILPSVAQNCDVRLFPAERIPRYAYAPKLRDALAAAANTADIIHVHCLYLYPTYAAFRAATRSQTPLIVSPHGALDPWIRRRGRLRKALMHGGWQARMFKVASSLHATTDEEAALWPAYARRRPQFVVPMGINLNEYRFLPDGSRFRRELGIERETPLIVNVGRISKKKGLDVLVRATANLHREGLSAHLAIVGPDDEGLKPSLRMLASHNQIGEFLHFPGAREGDAKLDALAAATVWALPSHTENFGIAVLEALAAGCPTVLSTEINLAPQVAAAGAGIITAPTVEATTRGLSTVLTDPGLRRALAVRSRDFAAEFDWSQVAENMLAAYESILEDRRNA